MERHEDKNVELTVKPVDDMKTDTQPETETLTEEMNKLLNDTFFSSLRWKLGPDSGEVQSAKFPLDVGQFYANYILKSLPPGKRLDIKKTRFKKFSTFLRNMNEDSKDGPVLTLKTVKGIDSIEQVNFDHPLVKNASSIGANSAEETLPSSSNAALLAPGTYLSVQEQMFSLTVQVMPLFRPVGLHRGDLLDQNRVRAILVEYGQNQNLMRDGGKAIELDDLLQMAVKHFLHDTFPLNSVVQKLVGAMTRSVLVRTRDGQEFIHRGKVPSVEIKVEKRMGNKVVTLVNNLISFGIDPKMVDKEIKGTGTSVLPSVQGCDGPQLFIQGNEVNSVARILERLGLPKKFVKGLDLGVKEKKKKK